MGARWKHFKTVCKHKIVVYQMKSARERNLCETTEELMAKYAKEKESN